MCGIVGAVAERDVTPILLEGLKRLEYRGYDSAGVAVVSDDGCLDRLRAAGKVGVLAELLVQTPVIGKTGIAHTRWATHGEPTENNAHPHICERTVAVVHNGIIENHEPLREAQQRAGYRFTSDTDTEVVVHQIHQHHEQGQDILEAVRTAVSQFQGAYALGVISNREPGRLIATREGSPLIIGVGIGEHFIASDAAALLPVTRSFIFLEEGDVADIRRDSVTIYDRKGRVVERPIKESQLSADAVERGEFRHYMLKEIYEQPRAIADTLEGRISGGRLLEESFGPGAGQAFDATKRVSIIACGTSYHAGLVGKYWLESIAGIPCTVEVASEYRYRQTITEPGTLLVFISQSGETADTLSALRKAKKNSVHREHDVTISTVAICNVPESSLMREAELTFLTRAGTEVGVASTKAFTTQLVSLMLLTIALGRRGAMGNEEEAILISELESLPRRIERIIELDETIKSLAEQFADKRNALFLGRGSQYPIAMEGALKLKEISYIHAEAYPAGELKHGPLALVDEEMPVIAVAPNNELLEKLKANLQEVRARGGQLYVFADRETQWEEAEGLQVVGIESMDEAVSPITFSVPLQLLAYHVAVLKGTDVDQPRNLAKSVTVE